MKLWVFGEALQNGQRVVFYVDASDYQTYIKRFQTILQIKMEVVKDDCYDILKSTNQSTVVNAIYQVLNEWALFSN